MWKYCLFVIVLLQPFFSKISAYNADSLLNVVATTHNDSLRVSAFNELAFHTTYSDSKQALKYIAESEKIALSKNLYYGYTQVLGIKAIVFDIGGKSDSALYYFKKSYRLSKRYHYKPLEVKALNGLGMNSWNSGQLKLAMQYFFTALRLNENIEQKKQLSPSIFYNNIGLIYQEMKLFDKALIYHQKAYKIRSENNLKKEIASSLNNIGICYKDKGKLNLAVSTFQKGINIAKASGNDVDYYRLINNLANVYNLQSKNDTAIQLLKTAIISSRKTGINQRTLVNIYGSIAVAYSDNNQPNESIEYAKKGLKIINDNPDLVSFGEDIYKMLIKNSFLLGDKKMGDKYLADYLKEVKNKFSKNNAVAIAELETKYETVKKEKLLLQKENEAREQRTLLLRISALAFIIVLLSIIFYRQLRTKQKQQAREFALKTEIAQIETQNQLQEQRISISRDLHDNIGSHLTFIISSINNLMYKYKGKNDALLDQLRKIESFATETIAELRDTIWAMDVVNFQFDDLKNRLIGFIEKQKSVNPDFKIEFEVDEKLVSPTLNSFAGITIYRIIQEFTNNTLKHAKATKLSINIAHEGDVLHVNLADNGVGFDLANCSRGHGLYNMEKRCQELNGEISIHSEPGNGTAVNLTFKTEFLK
jgi:signal transduction histidine kinase/Flp pilus assembly protein TadD